MKDREIDELLEMAVQAPHDVGHAVLERVAGSLHSSMRPVSPLPPTWLFTSGLVFICAAVALLGASITGFYGIEKMDVSERLVIFLMLGIFACAAGQAFVSEWIPGSRHRASPVVLLGVGSVVLLVVFAFLFRDYHTDHFVSSGLTCLFTGLLHAAPAALTSWLLLRRGFAVNPVASGLVGGTLAGLAGLTMLELHCANFQALHVLVWHTAVVPLSGAAGALLAWALRSRVGPDAPLPRTQ